MQALSATPPQLARAGIAVNQDGVSRSAIDLLALPGIDLRGLARIWPELREIADDTAAQIEIDAKYAGYLERQDADIAAYRRDEALELPPDLDYAAMTALSMEVRTKLAKHRPATLGQAARISGVTRFGLFVTVSDSGASGIVPTSSLPDDFWMHDERAQTLSGRRTRLTFRLGQEVEARL